MSKGYVYILTNPSMPGLVKIGKTTRDVEQRAIELYQTGIPTPFVVTHFVTSPDCHALEAAVHEALVKYRISSGREFFSVSVDVAISQIDNSLVEQVSLWIDDFLPCHTIVDGMIHVDEGSIAWLANELDEFAPDVALAMGEITPDEIKPALARIKAKRESRKSERMSNAQSITSTPVVLQ